MASVFFFLTADKMPFLKITVKSNDASLLGDQLETLLREVRDDPDFDGVDLNKLCP